MQQRQQDTDSLTVVTTATLRINLDGTWEVIGFGKKRHPSHLVLFRQVGSKFEQIHQSWLDGWSFSDQIEYLNEVAKNFKITKGYIDNTRGELEDRGLDRAWYPMHFTSKSKNTMAQIFEQYDHSNSLSLIKDERQRQQILSVNNELKAPETPLGHGDAFFSIAMALQAAYEFNKGRFVTLGSLTDWQEAVSPNTEPTNKRAINVSVSEKTPSLQDDFAEVDNTPTFKLVWNTNEENVDVQAPNPHCDEVVCMESFWVPERMLCLYCGYRRKN